MKHRFQFQLLFLQYILSRRIPNTFVVTIYANFNNSIPLKRKIPHFSTLKPCLKMQDCYENLAKTDIFVYWNVVFSPYRKGG